MAYVTEDNAKELARITCMAMKNQFIMSNYLDMERDQAIPQLADTLQSSKVGVEFIASHEKFRAKTYIDQAGYPTIGYGHKLLPGESFPKGITHDQALDLLAKDIQIARSAVQKNVTVKITQNQFDALVSLTYNIGSYAFATSTLLKHLNQSKINEAADQFLVWNKVTIDGKLQESSGLTKRRRQEREIFLYHLKGDD